MNGKYLSIIERTKIRAFTDQVNFQTRIGIVLTPQYEEWYDPYVEECNKNFDSDIEKLIEKHWGGGFTSFKLVKRDYNIVYSLTLSNGQNCYAKIKPNNDIERKSLNELSY